MLAETGQFINWVRVRSPQARTWRDYQCDLAIFKHRMGDRSVEEIRPCDVDGYVNALVEAGYKPSTVNRRLAAVASFYAFLIGSGRQISCPVIPRRHYLKEPQRLPRPVNEQELRKFFSAIRDVRDRAMFTLMLRCGLRIGEVSALKMDDLYLGESPSRIILHGKGSRERTVYLSPETERDLRTWLEIRARTDCEYVLSVIRNGSCLRQVSMCASTVFAGKAAYPSPRTACGTPSPILCSRRACPSPPFRN